MTCDITPGSRSWSHSPRHFCGATLPICASTRSLHDLPSAWLRRLERVLGPAAEIPPPHLCSANDLQRPGGQSVLARCAPPHGSHSGWRWHLNHPAWSTSHRPLAAPSAEGVTSVLVPEAWHETSLGTRGRPCNGSARLHEEWGLVNRHLTESAGERMGEPSGLAHITKEPASASWPGSCNANSWHSPQMNHPSTADS